MHRVSFNVPKGCIVGLVGPNGAGKTTLLHLMSGLLSPDSGNISIDGMKWKDLRFESEARAQVGLMPDTVRWQGSSTPRKVLNRLAIMRGHAIADLLSLVGLESREDETLDRLSTGMRQRLSLAAALLGSPGLLLLDEPLTGLDPVAQKALQVLLRQLADRGTTIIISSHLLMELEVLIDRVVLLHQGQVVIDGELNPVRKRLGLDRTLLLEGAEGNPSFLLSKVGNIVEASLEEGWSFLIEKEDGWSENERAEVVSALCEAGFPPFKVEARLADLAQIISAATGSDIASMDVDDAAMLPLSKMEVEEE